jgi:hypothetical protein
MIRAAKVRRLTSRTAAPAPRVARLTHGRGPALPITHDFSRIRVQRWSYGSGPPPDPTYRVVPDEQRKRVDDATGLLERVATHPKVYPVCKNYFKAECPGGSDASFSDEVNNAVIWLETDNTLRASSKKPHNVAFSAETWRWGRWTVAGELVHEMMHNCGQNNETSNDAAIKKCGFPDIEDFVHKTK